MAGKTYTFIRGAVLTCPDGRRYEVSSITLQYPEPLELVERGRVIRQEPNPKEPVKITFEEK